MLSHSITNVLDRDIEWIPPRGVACMKLRRWYIVVQFFFIIPVHNYNGKKPLFCKFTWRTLLEMYVILQTGKTLSSPLVRFVMVKKRFWFWVENFELATDEFIVCLNNATFPVIGPGHGSCYKIKRTSQIIIGWISLCHGHCIMAAWFIRFTIYLSQTKGTFPTYQPYKRWYSNEKKRLKIMDL